ncbi:MAG: hypothetical protein KAG14_03160 [Mycoplasmataceae bacterium]|nr:hypothetical protein [Mycoplasmataceae bacterium]
MKESKNINLNNIYLCSVNPRFSSSKLDLTGEYIRNQQKEESSAIENILKFEGDYAKLLDLFRSVSQGINEELEKPLVIDWENEKKIVVEGNRRILTLKVLEGELTLPSLDNIEKNNENDDQSYEEEIGLKTSSATNNYKKILKLVDEYQGSVDNVWVNQVKKDENENKTIVATVFSNHISGDALGKRNWNRGKTLDMYLSFLGKDDPLEESGIKELSAILNRTISSVTSNISSAILISSILESAGEDRESYFSKYKVSSLEKQFIREMIRKSGSYNPNDYFAIDSKTKKIFDPRNPNDPSTLAKFIIRAHKNGVLKTRMNKEDVSKNGIILSYFEKAESKEETLENGVFSDRTQINKIFTLTPEEKLKFDDDTQQIIKVFSEGKKRMDDISGSLKEKVKNIPDTPTKYALLKLRGQIELIRENNGTIKHLKINGIASANRALTEIFMFIFSNNSNIWTRISKEIKLDKKIVKFLQINSFIVKEDKSKEIPTQFIRPIFEKFLDGTIINGFEFTRRIRWIAFKGGLNKLILQNFTFLSDSEISKILDKNRFETESSLIHTPQMFEAISPTQKIKNYSNEIESLSIILSLLIDNFESITK